uniref:Uncharacterized protein n=1 Tax=Haemonchus contortus TaxID=6289 RepID=A0A7I4YA68_HAECO
MNLCGKYRPLRERSAHRRCFFTLYRISVQTDRQTDRQSALYIVFLHVISNFRTNRQTDRQTERFIYSKDFGI